MATWLGAEATAGPSSLADAGEIKDSMKILTFAPQHWLSHSLLTPNSCPRPSAAGMRVRWTSSVGPVGSYIETEGRMAGYIETEVTDKVRQQVHGRGIPAHRPAGRSQDGAGCTLVHRGLRQRIGAWTHPAPTPAAATQGSPLP